jgi:hypothetical protein
LLDELFAHRLVRQLFKGMAMISHERVIHIESDELDFAHVQRAIDKDLWCIAPDIVGRVAGARVETEFCTELDIRARRQRFSLLLNTARRLWL